jgi:dipeptidase E
VTTHVVAMGGGGFLRQGEASPLDRYVRALVGTPAPNVCFVPTASGDTQPPIDLFHRVFESLGCEHHHLSLFWRDEIPVADRIRDADVVYVHGGNTANLLALWRLHGVDTALEERRSSDRDLVVCGPSAGGLCWFDCGVTDSFGPQLAPLHDGMGWIAGSFCPHYDEEPRRQPVYRDLVTGGDLPAGIAVDGGAAAHYVDGALHAVIAELPDATAHTLALVDGALDEQRLEVRAI